MKTYDELKNMKIRALKKYVKEEKLDIDLSKYNSKNVTQLREMVMTLQGIEQVIDEDNVLKFRGITKPFEKWSKADLRQYCKEKDYNNYTQLKKDDLIKFIKEKKKLLNEKSPSPLMDHDLDINENDIKDFPDEKDWPKKLKELKELLKKYGVKNGIPTKKDEVKKMLKSQRCDPYNNKFCSNDEEKCDIRNNICMPPEFSNRKLQLYEYNGKKILGKPEDIKKLKEKLEKEQIQDLNKELDQLDIQEEDELEELSKQLDQLDIQEEEINELDDLSKQLGELDIQEEDENQKLDNDIIDKEIKKVEYTNEEVDDLDIQEVNDLVEDMNKMKIEDVKDEDNIQDLENILNEIQVEEDQDIDSITKVQNELYKCLGLLS